MSGTEKSRNIDPQAKALLDRMAAQAAQQSPPPTPAAQLAAAREGYRATIPLAGEPEAVGKVEDRRIPGAAGQIPIRIYTPREATGATSLPVVVYFHGGGFTAGDLDTHDPPLRSLANQANVRLISVGYRLAPENKFPAAPEDCYAATKYIAENADEFGVDKNSLAVAGDSAGGNLAAVVALLARDRNAPRILFQVLIYPNTDATMASDSWQELADADGMILNKKTMEANFAQYLPAEIDRKNAFMSPLYAHNLTNLPAAFVVTGEYDPLSDEGAKYAELLEAAGVNVTHKRYAGMIHGFFQMAGVLDAGKQVIDDIAANLRAHLGENGDEQR